jgi:hypothetical protein
VNFVAALMAFAGLALGGLFLLTGAGAPPPAATPLSAPLGPLAGSPLLALGGGLLYLLGTLLAGRGGAERPYAVREVALVLAAGGAAALTAALVVGVARKWTGETLAALAIGALGEALVAVVLSVRVAMLPDKRKLLFVPGFLLTAVVAIVHLVVLTLGAA